ncbi:MAG: ATP-binding cassette domain-containing protein [Bacilli bacterium]|nr:ATP-binding cassette domain-containing protein [Bacilli bacterium]
MEDILVIKKLHYKDVLNDLNLSIKNNTINFISGSNNCGKTALFKILTREIKNFNGYVNDLNNISAIFYPDLPFVFDNILDEMKFVLDNYAIDVLLRDERLNNLPTKYGLNPKKKISSLNNFEKIKLSIMLEECKSTKVLLLDNILVDLNTVQIHELMQLLKSLKKKMAIVISSSNLDNVLYGDYLHIIDEKKVLFSDEVLKVLKHDSRLNKLGLDLPFIADLSLKLKYYDLTDSIETNMNRLVRKLWD